MERKLEYSPFFLISLAFCIFSCTTEPVSEDIIPESQERTITNPRIKSSLASDVFLEYDTENSEDDIFQDNLGNSLITNALDDIDCSPSKITPILLGHLADLDSDALALENFNLYTNLSRTMALTDTSEQYFGRKGEYTSLMRKRIRELERFWQMPGELRVNAVHSENLNNREMLASMFYRMAMDEPSWEMAYEAADEILRLNAQSKHLPESVFFALDGFLSFANTIVIGDALVEILAETGIDPKIIYSSILSHEWAHQIQINNMEKWYPALDPRNTGINQVILELEADFFSAYFLTHKRGATYNWKRVEEFFELSFQLGDCNTWSELHHGTPQQRKLASKFGYELANSTRKKGLVLSPDALHEAFKVLLPELLNLP